MYKNDINNYKRIIPIFYACDDAFIKYAAVSVASIIKNANPQYLYKFHILVTDVCEQTKQTFLNMRRDNFDIEFNDVTKPLEKIAEKLPVREYYTKTTYYRMFIADMFPQYDKVIYIDSDTVVKKDISQLYNTDLGENYIGAVPERVMAKENIFGEYVEQVIGIDRYAFFNAGVLLIDCKKFRDNAVCDCFCKLLKEYNFVVTQDEDYLNVLCKDKVLFLNAKWNAEIFDGIPVTEDEVAVFHYIMTAKPWRYKQCDYADYFWEYAKQTQFFDDIIDDANAYTDAARQRDAEQFKLLCDLALKEIGREDNYLKKMRAKQNSSRVKVLEKICSLEKNGIFDVDVEDDPPTKPLPDKVDYTRKRIINKIKAKYAFHTARKFLNSALQNRRMIVKDIVGVENLKSVESGAILTCNHFNALDSFAMQMAYECGDTKKHKFYRVIREGNYTNFSGFYGYLMRHCNTLPLSSDMGHMKQFTHAVSEILKKDGFILVYAEQSMWWNYRKPKPLKRGAFSLAASNNVPVIPCFITMRDSDVLDDDGFFVQEYTIHIGKPIYPEKDKPVGYNTRIMKERNEELCKNIYESFYGIPLVYSCEDYLRDKSLERKKAE